MEAKDVIDSRELVTSQGVKMRVEIYHATTYRDLCPFGVHFLQLTSDGRECPTHGGYCLSTLAAKKPGSGLILWGDIPEWNIDAETYAPIDAWIKDFWAKNS